MNSLRDKLAEIYENCGIFENVWEARNDYIKVILDRSDENVKKFLKKHVEKNLSHDERIRALMFLEMQRNSLLMFTSCGWFFDEISRIEPVQIMRYAARAIELAKTLTGEDLEPSFLKLLAQAPSNVPELQDGAKIYELRAKQGQVDPKQMAAYYGITSLFDDFRREFSEGCWDMAGSAMNVKSEGQAPSFSAGKVHVHSRITGIEGDYLFAVNVNEVHTGGSALISCGICETDMKDQITPDEVMELHAIYQSDEREKLLFEKFGYDQFTINNIPSNSRYRIINALLERDVRSLENALKDRVKHYDQLFEHLTLLGSKPPAILTVAAQFTLTAEIVEKLEDSHPDVAALRRMFELAGFQRIKPDEERVRFAFSDCMNEILTGLCMGGLDVSAIENLNELISLFSKNFAWHLSLYESQNLYYELLKQNKEALKKDSERIRAAMYRLGHELKFSDEILGFLK